jgi:hypothetical protein
VEKLKSSPEGDGSVLDHAMVLYGSGMSDANNHTHHPLPLALLGGGNGRLTKLGHHLAFPDDLMANFLLTVAQRAGARLTSFGRSTKTLDI